MKWLEKLHLRGAPELPGPHYEGTVKIRWHFRVDDIHDGSATIMWRDENGFHAQEVKEGTIVCFTANLNGRQGVP